MTRILLIRHGSTDLMSTQLCGRLPGIPLNSAGRQQAEQLAVALKARAPVSAVYSSPLQRAQETALAIASHHNLPVLPEPAINELEFGDWTGRSFTDLHSDAAWKSYNRYRSLSGAPAGESLLDVQTRAWKALRRLLDAHPQQRVAVVTHGDVIRSLLLLLLGMPLDNILRLEIAPASVSEVSFEGGVPVLHCLNLVLYDTKFLDT